MKTSRIEPGQIADRLEIAELVNRYALHIDLHEIKPWVELFSEDAFFDEREFGTGLHVGHAAIRAYGEMLAATVAHAVHLMSNLVIRNLTATSASGVVFASVEAQMKTGERLRWQVRYEDEFVNTDAGWKFARRILRRGLPPEDIGRS
jgi:SnoaL-like domain